MSTLMSAAEVKSVVKDVRERFSQFCDKNRDSIERDLAGLLRTSSARGCVGVELTSFRLRWGRKFTESDLGGEEDNYIPTHREFKNVLLQMPKLSSLGYWLEDTSTGFYLMWSMDCEM